MAELDRENDKKAKAVARDVEKIKQKLVRTQEEFSTQMRSPCFAHLPAVQSQGFVAFKSELSAAIRECEQTLADKKTEMPLIPAEELISEARKKSTWLSRFLRMVEAGIDC